MSALPKLLEEARGKMAEMAAERERAREGAVRAIRALELALVEGLEGETLRGLPCLGETGEPRFYGMRVRGRHDKPLQVGKNALVLDKHGQFTFAMLGPAGSVVKTLVRDAEFLAEDIEGAGAAVDLAVRTHLRAIERATQRYRALARIAEALSGILGRDRVPGPGGA